jgi:hypothetical protein
MKSAELLRPALNAITFSMKLFRKTEVWRPTRWGLLLAFLLLSVLGFGLALGLYPFFAQTRPLAQPQVIIIEGWLADAELAEALEQLDPGALLVTTGGPIKLAGILVEEKTYAEVTTARLSKLGIPPERMLTVSAPDTVTDRTYVSALAVRRALEEQGLLGRPANLYSLGPHSRRSFLLYRLALGPEVPLGVVAIESQEFDLRHWWKSSLAFKHVMSELMSWTYVQCTRWKY